VLSLYERVVDRLLVESKTDTLAKQLVQHIIVVCKAARARINTQKKLKVMMEVPWPSFLKKRGVEGASNTRPINFQLQIIVVKGRRDAASVSGFWAGSKNILQVEILVESTTGDLQLEMLSMIQTKCYETVRHELEHATQPPEYIKQAASVNRNLTKYANIWEDPEAVEAYFSSPGEVEAYVAGIYHASKRARMPFIGYANNLIKRYIEVARKHGSDVSKVRAVFQRVRKLWIAYAKKRFPLAVIGR